MTAVAATSTTTSPGTRLGVGAVGEGQDLGATRLGGDDGTHGAQSRRTGAVLTRRRRAPRRGAAPSRRPRRPPSGWRGRGHGRPGPRSPPRLPPARAAAYPSRNVLIGAAGRFTRWAASRATSRISPSSISTSMSRASHSSSIQSWRFTPQSRTPRRRPQAPVRPVMRAPRRPAGRRGPPRGRPTCRRPAPRGRRPETFSSSMSPTRARTGEAVLLASGRRAGPAVARCSGRPRRASGRCRPSGRRAGRRR